MQYIIESSGRIEMLHHEQITIGKLKQAYVLNAQEAESLLNALFPDSVFPFETWRKAYEKWGMDSLFEGSPAKPLGFAYIPDNSSSLSIAALADFNLSKKLPEIHPYSIRSHCATNSKRRFLRDLTRQQKGQNPYFSMDFGLSWSCSDLNLVEVAGIEPASEKSPPQRLRV